MEDQFYKQLVDRYLNKRLSDEELEVFIHLLNKNELDRYLLEAMDKDQESVLKLATPVKRIHPKYGFIYKAAAVIIISCVGFLGYQYFSKPASNKLIISPSLAEIRPASNKAILTLSNGKKVILNDSGSTFLKNGEITTKKGEGGIIIYDIAQQSSNSKSAGFNTITTPKGGIYQIVLPDKSKIWLNNESSITFPVKFSQNERRVEVTGEVYFEVASNKNKPFRVISKKQVVEVLGTHFNVNAYQDEPETKTTLLEGAVNVSTATQSKRLKPGLQSIIGNTNDIAIAMADLHAAIAWKEGFFEFDKVDIQVLMRQISRWYDIDVEYKGAIPKDEFVGKIKRSSDINEVLKILKYGNVKFQFKGRKLIVG